MMATCTMCSQWAKSVNAPEPQFMDREINQDTGLCWNVCDMEREVDEIEYANWQRNASDEW